MASGLGRMRDRSKACIKASGEGIELYHRYSYVLSSQALMAAK